MSNEPVRPTNGSLRNLPSVNTLLESTVLRESAQVFGQSAVTTAVREAIDRLRQELKVGKRLSSPLAHEAIAQQVADAIALQEKNAIRPVINATGILLHTGLGRAPLASEAVEAAAEAARSFCNVELDLETGERSQRSQVVEPLLRELTGAEAAHVVNNNAGATGLIVAALATAREVIVSHGELIEIGGGFRLPDVISAYGATLKPVGTTNKTRVEDYASAIGEQTGALLVVHPSNYCITGFTEQPDLAELVALARQHDLPLVHDIGSGALIDFQQFGCAGEPVAAESIAVGADLVLFSGDKLLGGPQCGIIVGRRKYVQQVAHHPLSRALRVDKVTLAALRATLQLYRNPHRARQSIPLLRLLSTPLEELKQRTDRLADQLRSQIPGCEVQTAADEAFVGGGSLPQQGIPSWSLSIAAEKHNIAELAQRLRMGDPAVVGRVQGDKLMLSLHALYDDQDQQLLQASAAALSLLACRKS